MRTERSVEGPRPRTERNKNGMRTERSVEGPPRPRTEQNQAELSDTVQ